MLLFVWIGVCALGAVLLRRHLTISIACVLALWFLIPTVGSYLLTGQKLGPLAFHCATWLILAIAITQLVWAPEALGKSVFRHRFLFLLLALVLSVAFLTTRTVQSGGGMVLFVDQMVAPALLFLLILAAGTIDAKLVPRLRNALMLLFCIVVIVAVFQWSTGSVLFYEAGFKTQFWFNPETKRWMGTFDQPLALSLVACALTPMVAGIRRLYIAIPLLALLVTAVLISQSRVGTGVVIASILYAVLFSRHKGSVKVAVVAAMGIGTYFLLMTPLVAGVLARVADDTGSAEARNQAYGVFFRDWSKYLFTGEGLTASYGVADFAGLQTSFESSIIMYAVDIGIVFAVLYFGALLVVVLQSAGRHSVPGLTLAGLLVVLIPQTYSGVATRSVAGIVIWTIVAMAAAAAQTAADAGSAQRPTAAAGPGRTAVLVPAARRSVPPNRQKSSNWTGR
ncbi:hypothetical protein IV500_02685 [Paeniglutamicibacter antarcticus]|uniref:Uncharacterized protein n=1 Tax=Arthrobacter terrae TaxID=2935737 RepID=A0A931CGV5_9MICC|nr:hypothetical protein [Arthrobacter terrae]MBG0738337.1 hypothetical protein [Arthrobacter terrae]